jgi:hypothetical protein
VNNTQEGPLRPGPEDSDWETQRVAGSLWTRCPSDQSPEELSVCRRRRRVTGPSRYYGRVAPTTIPNISTETGLNSHVDLMYEYIDVVCIAPYHLVLRHQ